MSGTSPVIVTAEAGMFSDEDEVYTYDWSAHLVEHGDVIVNLGSITFTATGGALHDKSHAGAVTTFWVVPAVGSRSVLVKMLATTNSTPPRKTGVNITIPVVKR